MLPDGGGRVGSGKNDVSGGSSTDRDNDGHDVDVDCRRRRRCRPRARRTATALVMMTMAGERGGKATARRMQDEDEARRQSYMAPPEPARGCNSVDGQQPSSI